MKHCGHPPSTTAPDDWESIRAALLQAAPKCGINMAHAAVTRHANGPLRHRPAIRWRSSEGDERSCTYATLERLTNRAANGLKELGILPGQVVASLCGRVPELYIGALGALKAGAQFCALYTDYGPEPILHRLAASRASVLITTRRQYTKIRDLRSRLPDLAHVLLVDPPAASESGVESLRALFDVATDDFTIPPTDPETPALIHFTSGTTGMPKGVVHVHAATLHQILTGCRVLDLRPEDTYWCTADPGWVTGVVYGFLAPLMAGAATIIDEAEFDVTRWLEILSGQQVSVWYTSPSALRRLMTLPGRPRETYDLTSLRLAFSVGEPLHAAVVRWGREALGVPIRDTWWQTETGGIMIANQPGDPVCPGAMGRPVAGIRAGVLTPSTTRNRPEACRIGEVGELALAVGWPSMFRRLLGNDAAYRQRFTGNWYLTGDLVRCDRDGVYWFVGRADDMIKTAGHLVSPFEVESVLLAHPEVAEAGVIGVPDPHLGQRVTAHLRLTPGATADAAASRRIMAFARERLGPALAPRDIVFTAVIPRNPAGKIVRRELAGPAR